LASLPVVDDPRVEAADHEAEETPAEAAVVEVVASGEQTAQKRRCAFKLIDGGN